MAEAMDVSTAAQRQWETTGRGKVICPDCGRSGYYGGKWANKHVAHLTCSCGRRVTVAGLGSHRASMIRHGKPCPEVEGRRG